LAHAIAEFKNDEKLTTSLALKAIAVAETESDSDSIFVRSSKFL
jgi:hypothetical protein